MRQLMRNLLLADRRSVRDDTLCPPPAVPPQSLVELLDTVASSMQPGGVLMLSAPWDTYLEDIPLPREAPVDKQVDVQVGENRWTARMYPGDIWIRWTQPDSGHYLWTAEIDGELPGHRSAPLIDADPTITALNFHSWTRATGCNWTGTPGMTGCSLLRDGYPEGAYTPHWAPKGEWKYGDIEQPYLPTQWSRDPDGPLEYGYDANKSYLSTLKTIDLPADALTPERRTTFDPSLGGLWRCDIAPWHREKELPDPAGYAPALPDGTRWLTTPTVQLLEDLHTAGEHGGYAIFEARIAPTRRITRQWGETLHSAIKSGNPAMAKAAQRVYNETYGMWRRKGGRISRPDWHYSVIALDRANRWRKMNQYAKAGRLPTRIETDALFYCSDADTAWVDAAPEGMKLDTTGIKLGHHKPVNRGVGRAV